MSRLVRPQSIRRTGAILLIAVLCGLSGLSSGIADEQSLPPVLSESEAVARFIYARAAAETCFGRELSPAESARYYRSLSYRDSKLRSAARLARDLTSDVDFVRQAAADAGCDAQWVRDALADWNFRVATLSDIDFAPSVAEETATPRDDEGATATGSIDG